MCSLAPESRIQCEFEGKEQELTLYIPAEEDVADWPGEMKGDTVIWLVVGPEEEEGTEETKFAC
jgi:hypothetical protein